MLVVAMSFACSAPGEEEEELHSAVSVESIVVEPRAFTETIDAIGTVEVRAGHSAALSAPAPTRVTAVMTAVGERVRKGAALVELERAVFEAAASSAEAALASAQQAYDRADRLVQAGIAPKRDLAQAATELAVAAVEPCIGAPCRGSRDAQVSSRRRRHAAQRTARGRGGREPGSRGDRRSTGHRRGHPGDAD
jgi:multidrug efflux pump subunit AcrA (membrane-fusion protein)